MTHLLDTDHISVLEHGKGAGYAALVANLNLRPAADIGVSVVSYHEQALGRNARIHAARTDAELLAAYELFATVIDLFRSFPIVPYDAAALAEFQSLRSIRPQLAVMDRRIAAIARSRNLTVVTRNARDFGRVPGLRIEDWTR